MGLVMVIISVVWHSIDGDATYGIPVTRGCYLIYLVLNDRSRSRRNFGRIGKMLYGMLPIYGFNLFMILVYSCMWTVMGFNFNSDYR
jgi:hypothetical protein